MNQELSSVDIFGVKVDKVTMAEAVFLIEKWLSEKQKRMVFTPNIEFVMAAQKDKNFKEILNKADLAIPDSSRFGWALKVFTEKNSLKKFLIWLTFLMPSLLIKPKFPVVTGTDLMEKLLALGNEKGFRIGLIGSNKKVAKSLGECLKKDYPALKVEYIEPDLVVNYQGEVTSWKENPKLYQSNIEILFVGLGHIKQELWIYKNRQKIPAKVFIGVGGAFDYLSQEVPRAPKFIRNLGLEWLFRLFIQPWRIKRFGALVKFVFLVLAAT